MDNAIGIDLGTTFSVIGFFDRDGRCRTIANSEGDLTTPSVVYFDADQPIVGKEAVKAGAFEPDRCAFLAKRDMGKNHYHREILGQSLPPEVIQAIVLRKLKQDAAIALGEVSRAVITVPAYFNEPRRKATQDAGNLAGLEVLDIINEPTAAAIAFGVQEGFLDQQGAAAEKELILVYDLGGGTFDATLMEIEGASYRALATGGDVHLGGVDWDRRIADYVADEFRRQHGFDPRNDPAASQELYREAEDAKRALTARSNATIHVSHGGKRMRLDFSRDKLKELTDDLASRTIFTCKKVLADAKRSWSDVTRVLGVGGSSRMPLVLEALEAETGMPVDRSLAPDEAVAHGAAIYARLVSEGQVGAISNLSVTNVCSHDLGVLGVEKATGMPRRKVLIPRNTALPARGSGRFVTRSDDQKDVAVKVIEGGDASGNHSTPIGRFLVENLPKGARKGSPVVVTFTYRQDGRLDVSASVNGVEGSGTMSVERATGLGDAEIDLWKGRIEKNQVVQQPAGETAAPATEPVVEPTPASGAVDSTPPAEPQLGGDDLDQLLDGDQAELLGEDFDPLLGEDLPPEAEAEPTSLEPPAATEIEQTTTAVNVEPTVDPPSQQPPEQPEVQPVVPAEPLLEAPTEQPVQPAAATVSESSPEPTPAQATPAQATPAQATPEQPVFESAAAVESPAESPAEEATDFTQPLFVETPAGGAPATESTTDAKTEATDEAPFVSPEGGSETTESEATEAPEFEPTPQAAEAPTAADLGIEEESKEDVALGGLEFLEEEETKSKAAEDDNDLQDFFSSFQ